MVDFSRQVIDRAAWVDLIYLAAHSDVENGVQRLFRGELVNCTEKRAALHVALRDDGTGLPINVDGADIRAEVAATRVQCREFCDSVRSG